MATVGVEGLTRQFENSDDSIIQVYGFYRPDQTAGLCLCVDDVAEWTSAAKCGQDRVPVVQLLSAFTSAAGFTSPFRW